MIYSWATSFVSLGLCITKIFIISDLLSGSQKALDQLKLAKYIGLFFTLSSYVGFDIRLSICNGCQ